MLTCPILDTDDYETMEAEQSSLSERNPIWEGFNATLSRLYHTQESFTMRCIMEENDLKAPASGVGGKKYVMG